MKSITKIKGYEQIGSENVAYWGFEAKKNPETAPLIIYFGGYGMIPEIFYGNGPFRLEDNKVVENKLSWTNFANVFYVDFLLGTKLSYSSFSRYHKQPFKKAQVMAQMIYACEYLQPSWKHKSLYIGSSHEHAKVTALAAKLIDGDHLIPFKLVRYL